MSLPAQPQAQLDVVTTATHVLAAFEQMVLDELGQGSTAVVYDEELSFESGIKAYLAKNNFNQQAKTDFPVFLYNRSQLRWPKQVAPSRRLNNLTGFLKLYNTDGSLKGGVSYSATQNEFDIDFMYLCRSVEQQERFEVSYQGETGISANRTIVVDMGGPLGDFNYYLSYTDLTQKKINYKDSAYVAAMGRITVRGIFMTFTGPVSIIRSIGLRVFVKPNVVPNVPGDLSGLDLIISVT
jgi:hypothetical protein